MLVGDKVKYNHLNEVVILKIEGNYALIQFDSGTKICTKKTQVVKRKNLLKLSASRCRSLLKSSRLLTKLWKCDGIARTNFETQ